MGFSHSCELNEGELWVGVTLNGEANDVGADGKGTLRSVGLGVDGKPHQLT